MKKYFFLSIIVVAFGYLAAASAEVAIGEHCEKLNERNVSCVGNTATTLACSRPEGVAFNCYSAQGSKGLEAYCSPPYNSEIKNDQCADQYKAQANACIDSGNACLTACVDQSKSCTKSCPCDASLGSMWRCSSEYDTKYASCLNSCEVKEDLCRSNCVEQRTPCLRSSYDAYQQCDKSRWAWKKTYESVCASNKQCIQDGGRARCGVLPGTPASTNKSATDDFFDIMDKIVKCQDEVNKKFGLFDKDKVGCKNSDLCEVVFKCYQPFSPDGFWEECMSKGAPEVLAGYEECARRYPVDGIPTKPAAPIPVADIPADASPDASPPNTFCQAVATEQNSADAVEKEDKNIQKALARLNKIKKSGDERAIEHAIEDELALLDKDSKEKMQFIRATADDIHETASNGVGWQEFPETLESIKKSEYGKYGKLDLATDAVKSFNEYHEERAKGRTVADASTKAALDNFGSTALTLIPVFKAIDLVASTPDILANVLGVDEENWWRKKITKGFIGKFAPSDVIKQTTDLMAENKWSDIGNTLAYGWNNLKNADGVYDTLLQTGTLLDASIGAVPVAIARGMSDTLGATIFLGQTAINCASNLFGY